MIWWIIGAVIVFNILLSLWKTYNDPAYVLFRQAANMNWVISRTIVDEDGYKNKCLARDNFEVMISYKHKNVILIKPDTNRAFKDFIELEHWISNEN